jgi:hypothetical protein
MRPASDRARATAPHVEDSARSKARADRPTTISDVSASDYRGSTARQASSSRDVAIDRANTELDVGGLHTRDLCVRNDPAVHEIRASRPHQFLVLPN